jgi:predicted transcriptional regulator
MGRIIDGRKQVTDIIGRTKTIGTAKYIPTTGTKGSSDISATINGKSVKIEVKIGSDRQSKYQIEYQERTEKSGGIYLIAKDFESFYNDYKKIIEMV